MFTIHFARTFSISSTSSGGYAQVFSLFRELGFEWTDRDWSQNTGLASEAFASEMKDIPHSVFFKCRGLTQLIFIGFYPHLALNACADAIAQCVYGCLAPLGYLQQCFPRFRRGFPLGPIAFKDHLECLFSHASLSPLRHPAYRFIAFISGNPANHQVCCGSLRVAIPLKVLMVAYFYSYTTNVKG
jgi:hypothetical protein